MITRYRVFVFTDMVNSRCFRVRPDSQLFNSWGLTAGGRGWGVPLPSQLEGLMERRKLPQRPKNEFLSI